MSSHIWLIFGSETTKGDKQYKEPKLNSQTNSKISIETQTDYFV